MRYVLSVALLAFAAGTSPASAGELILTSPALAQTDPATLPPGPQPVGPQPVEPLPPGGEVIRPLEFPPPDQPPPESGFWESITGVQWLGLGVTVIGIAALAASGDGGDEPEPAASGGN